MKITKFLTLLALFLVGLQANAQNVTVKPSTGSMIAAVPEDIGGGNDDYDTFFRRGGFATWRHNQLCLTMTTSDAPGLTANGQLSNPANNLYGRTSTNEIEMGRGALENTRNCYMNLALPKGYRFTGYEIVFSRNRDDFGNNGYQNNSYTRGTTRFGETDKDFNFYDGYYQDITYNANATLENGSVTITKEDETGMSNVLYFKLTDADTGKGRMVITFHSITLYFTAEDDYTPVLPQSNISIPVSAVDIPFQTGKVDYGSIESRSYNNQTRVSYSSANVVDMTANMTLYEEESVTGGSHFDGTSGNVVNYQEGAQFTIRNYNDFFILGKSGQEQVYYIESPTYVTLPDENHTKNPVGFRIVGAELEYEYGSPVPASTVTRTFHYITYTSGDTKYYLNKEGRFVANEKTEWYTDDYGRIYNGSTYLGFTGSGNGLSTRTYTFRIYDTAPSNPLVVNNSGYITGSYHPVFTTFTVYLHGSTSSATVSESTSNRAVWETDTETTNIPAFTPAPFKLHVYDKDGTLKETIEVNSSEDNGKVVLTGFNNDAVKFGVEGIGFVKGNLTMQALDPYIDRMTVVCQDQAEGKENIRMTRTFNANDFSVSGGEFYFYLPSDCVGDGVKITYEDLWSRYADETYAGGSDEHNSRFSFVNSEHYNQYTSDNVYNNTAEAAADAKNVHERQIVESVGRTKFKFNNADELSTQAGILTEYPFTQANYAGAPNNGSFYVMNYTVSTKDQQQTAYVFTTDETRYNIAPTTAVQHRTYAFYEMIVHVQSSTYDPKVEIVKIYDKTCYDKDGGNTTDAFDAFYGAVVTAPFGTPAQKGFASDYEVETAIDDVITLKKDDFGNTDVPASAKQILYVDMTGLAGYYTNAKAPMTLGAYRSSKLAPNAIVFMPKGVTTTDDNFAYMTDGNNLRASKNIILTDKQPFYSPYNIQVASENFAQYTRKLTYDGYEKDVNAMVMLPYALSVSGGLHSNPEVDGNANGKFSFTVNEMKSANLTEQSRNHNYGIAYFAPVSGEKTVANRPYMVKVDEASVEGSEVSFKAIEKGALIQATSPMSSRTGSGENNAYSYNYLFTGETVNGSLDTPGMTVKLQSEGSYSGQQYDRADSEAIFYFANNMFYNLYKLMSSKRYLYAYPFHPVYSFSGNISNNVKALGGLDITLEPDDVDGIRDFAQVSNPDLAVRTGKGFIQFTSAKDQTVSILSLNGTAYSKVTMNAGDSKTISLPAGVYVVNNVKIIVK